MQKNVILTGASSGIGKATAYVFAGKGCGLYLTSRRINRLEEMAPGLMELGAAECHSAGYDLCIPETGARLVEDALERLSFIDILICNAGYGLFGPAENVSPAEMARMWQVNYQSAYESILAILPHFRERGRGHIVLVSSINGKKGMAGSAAYSATKFAMVGLGEALWAELKDSGINVSVVCPGYTETEFHGIAAARILPEKKRSSRGQNAGKVALAIESAVRKNKREVHLTFSGKLILFLERISNGLAIRVMAAAAKKDPLRNID
ncbi:MAG: SDR family NAD(P)-dependent oxidoreductase [Acidobacteriota bacterium]